MKQLRLVPYAVILGACIAVFSAREKTRDAMCLVEPRGPFWQTENATGTPVASSSHARRLSLLEDRQLRLFDPDHNEIRSVSFLAQRTSDTAYLELWRDHKVHARLRFTLRAGSATETEAHRESLTGLPDIPLTHTRHVGVPENPFAPFRVRLDVSDKGGAVYVDGELMLVVAEPGPSAQEIVVAAKGGAWTFQDLRVTAGEEILRDDFSQVAEVSSWSSIALAVGGALIGYLVLFAFLRALCLGRPTLGELHRATMATLFFPATCFLSLFVAPRFYTPWIAAISIFPGLIVGAFLLREHLRGVGAGRVRPLAITLSVAISVSVVAAGLRHDDVLRQLAPERRAALLDSLPFAKPHLPQRAISLPSLQLDGSNEFSLSGRYRDFAADSLVFLAEDSAFQLRFRSSGGPEGISLIVSSDPEFRSGLYRETLEEFAPIDTAPCGMPTSKPIEVHLEVDARNVRATIGDQRFEMTETGKFLRGSLRLVAVGGSVDVSSFTITPYPSDPNDLPSVTAHLVQSAVSPWVLLLLFGLLLSRITNLPWPRALEVTSFALFPFLATLVLQRTVGSSDVGFAAGSALTILTLLAAPMVHGGSLTPLRYLALVAAAVGLTLPLLSSSVGPKPVVASANARNDRLNQISLNDWQGERLSERWVHVQHPLLRRFNSYLVDHRLRGRSYPVTKPDGTRRVMAIGSSSTFGYNIPEESQLDWPSQLERQLRSHPELGNVEVLNAAVCGSTGIRLFYFLENSLIQFAPDVILLSLYYNDSIALSQGDEPAHYDTITSPDYRRSRFVGFLERLRMQRERRALATLLLPTHDVTRTAEVWRASAGADVRDPPTRFRDGLRRFAQLADAHGAKLVLIKEPIRDDRPRIWKEEFYREIDQVGDEYGLEVVDPPRELSRSPLLGSTYFMDDVHLHPAGCAVMAKSIAPVVVQLLADRTAPAPVGSPDPAEVSTPR